MMILDMSDALDCFTQPIIFTEVDRYTIDFEEVESRVDTTIQAVVQPSKPEDLNTTQVDWSKAYMTVHSVSQLKINAEFSWNGKNFKIVTLSDYTGYNYFEAIGEEIK